MFAEFLFRRAIVAWVSNAFAIRINYKRVQSDIHTQRGINRDFNWVWNFNNDCGIPTGRLLGDGQRLNFAIGQRSVVIESSGVQLWGQPHGRIPYGHCESVALPSG